jgi:hypothetical protein
VPHPPASTAFQKGFSLRHHPTGISLFTFQHPAPFVVKNRTVEYAWAGFRVSRRIFAPNTGLDIPFGKQVLCAPFFLPVSILRTIHERSFIFQAIPPMPDAGRIHRPEFQGPH